MGGVSERGKHTSCSCEQGEKLKRNGASAEDNESASDTSVSCIGDLSTPSSSPSRPQIAARRLASPSEAGDLRRPVGVTVLNSGETCMGANDGILIVVLSAPFGNAAVLCLFFEGAMGR